MGGQLVFDWDRLENFLITRDRPVGNIVTSTKCQSWVSHVHMQCTIGLVSDVQWSGTPRSGRASVTAATDRRQSEVSGDSEGGPLAPWLAPQFFL